MAIEASISDPVKPGAVTSLYGSRLALEAPSDVRLALDATAITGYEKVGADLVLRLADGSTYRIDDFFKIGSDGDYSRLLTAADQLVAAGVMVPEPDYSEEAPALFSFGTGDAMNTGADPAQTAASETDGGGIGGLLDEGLAHFAGAGLLVGSGVVFFSDNDDDTGEPSPAPAPDAAPDREDAEHGGATGSENGSDAQDIAGLLFADAEVAIEDADGQDAATAQEAFDPEAEQADHRPEEGVGARLSDSVGIGLPHDLLSDLEVETAAW